MPAIEKLEHPLWIETARTGQRRAQPTQQLGAHRFRLSIRKARQHSPVAVTRCALLKPGEAEAGNRSGPAARELDKLFQREVARPDPRPHQLANCIERRGRRTLDQPQPAADGDRLQAGAALERLGRHGDNLRLGRLQQVEKELYARAIEYRGILSEVEERPLADRPAPGLSQQLENRRWRLSPELREGRSGRHFTQAVTRMHGPSVTACPE